jgi:primosomal protein N' (replication factor Y) (superfamily II helicase)
VSGDRWIQVALDAAGVPGGRTFTYHVPRALRELAIGEAVLVDYGRRRSIGLVMGDCERPVDRDTKPVLARIHSRDPLLPELSMSLARHIAEHYLAPPGMVVRQMLPPGMLESVELVAHARDGGSELAFGQPAAQAARRNSPETVALVAAVREGGADGRAVDALPQPTSRATLLRRLREMEAAGVIELEWRVRPPGAGPRFERTALITEEGRAAAAALSAGSRPPGRPLGPRQRALLAELAASPDPRPEPGARLAERHGASAISGLAKRGLLELRTGIRERRPLADRRVPGRGALPPGADLTAEQAGVVELLAGLVAERRHEGILLDGVTASGKTAVYAAAVGAALHAGRPAMVMVPEIALATPLIDRLGHDLGVEIAVLHSGLGDGERADEWRRIRAGEAMVVVGTRMALLAPLSDVGVVIVDEEQDPAYKSDRTPRYQARDAALVLGRLAGAPVVLGSATPDVVSVGRARLGQLRHIRLRERAAGARPNVEVVDLRAELSEGNRGLLSAALVGALRALNRERGDRAILVINRRGSASVVLCRDCGYVQICPECQRPLVFHATGMALRCHHCGASAPVARRCPACESPRIRYLGGGTERVEQEVRIRLPDLRVGRLDRDVAERRGEAARIVDAFADGELDVLVGTSLVAKGLDVPEVTLVGVVSADVALNLPDERAAERTWQLLEQAVGRAGRGDRPGRALIQSYQPDHPAIVAVAERDATAFIDGQLEQRERYGSAPFGSVVKLTAALEERESAETLARDMAATLRSRAADANARVAVLGPVPAYVARRGGRWRFHVVLRGTDPLALLGGDPGPPWSIDVDPESLL